MSRSTAVTGPVSAEDVAGIVIIVSVSVVIAANGVAEDVVPTPALGWDRFGIATIDFQTQSAHRKPRPPPAGGLSRSHVKVWTYQKLKAELKRPRQERGFLFALDHLHTFHV